MSDTYYRPKGQPLPQRETMTPKELAASLKRGDKWKVAEQKETEGIHSCSYYCHYPACIKAQRDELRDKLFPAIPQPPASFTHDENGCERN